MALVFPGGQSRVAGRVTRPIRQRAQASRHEAAVTSLHLKDARMASAGAPPASDGNMCRKCNHDVVTARDSSMLQLPDTAASRIDNDKQSARNKTYAVLPC